MIDLDSRLTGEQIRAARALLRMEQLGLAREAGLSLETIKRLERIRGPVEATRRTLGALEATFRAHGVVFDLTAGRGPGLRLMAPDETQMPPPARRGIAYGAGVEILGRSRVWRCLLGARRRWLGDVCGLFWPGGRSAGG